MPCKPYQPKLLARLTDADYAALYLKTGLDESRADGNTETFLLALKNVVEARLPIAQAASQSQVSQQQLHKLLSGQGNPMLDTLLAILQSAGLSLDFTPATTASQKHDRPAANG